MTLACLSTQVRGLWEKASAPTRAVGATGEQVGGGGGPWRSRKDDEVVVLVLRVPSPLSIR